MGLHCSIKVLLYQENLPKMNQDQHKMKVEWTPKSKTDIKWVQKWNQVIKIRFLQNRLSNSDIDQRRLIMKETENDIVQQQRSNVELDETKCTWVFTHFSRIFSGAHKELEIVDVPKMVT